MSGALGFFYLACLRAKRVCRRHWRTASVIPPLYRRSLVWNAAPRPGSILKHTPGLREEPHLDGQKPPHPHQTTRKQNAETQLILHVHNPIVIRRLIFTSGLSGLCETLIWPKNGEIRLKVPATPAKILEKKRNNRNSSFAVSCFVVAGQIIRHTDQHQRPQQTHQSRHLLERWSPSPHPSLASRKLLSLSWIGSLG